MDDYTELDNSEVFNLKIQSKRPLETWPELVMSISIEMDLDLIEVQRNLYTILDLLSDIGGFTSIFLSGLSFLIALWNFNNYEYHFLKNFFKKKAPSIKANKKVHAHLGKIENFEPKHICNIQEYLLNLIPSLGKVSCCRRNSK